ncbi:DUF3995 domain-containing protein [Alphaproteobacteria bacterium GH1-50]|uniref:DUF3995 domain-containing protein n=1 Tax=Kangsaoukella pontilimi TaxID=2691042 RepID=A0A7C9IQH6_9RHOB|nr:DUF3995 domain-containing protein [Kangsaoukella pontilimi]MXQ07703.1 DUF3995 domain-containing protein [Kangsaoukella pontilimi]
MIAFLLSAVLLVLAGFHLLWALGYWMPIRDEAALARAVTGQPGATRMPGAAPTAAVTAALMLAAAWPWFEPSPVTTIGLMVLALIFLARGAAAWVPVWRRLTPEEPFPRLDRTLYGPLCLIIGAGFTTLATRALT